MFPGGEIHGVQQADRFGLRGAHGPAEPGASGAQANAAASENAQVLLSLRPSLGTRIARFPKRCGGSGPLKSPPSPPETEDRLELSP